VPVVDEDGSVLGVVSEADILAKERSRGGNRSLLDHLLEANGADTKHDARDAADAMTSPAVVIRPDRPVAEAAALMLDRSVNRLPVVGEVSDAESAGLLSRFVERVPGVVGIRSRVTWPAPQ
jgi:CBS domain-containing protein